MTVFVRPSNNDIREMPLFEGLSADNIIMVSNEQALAAASALIAGVSHVGFDSESKPCFNKGEKSKGPHVIQLATSQQGFLFTPHFMPGIELALTVLSAHEVTKYGFGLADDKKLFRTKFGAEINTAIDLASVAKTAFGFKQNVGAKCAIATLFSRRLSKTAQTSNWERYPLNLQQVLYAANDAYAGVVVATELKRLKLFDA